MRFAATKKYPCPICDYVFTLMMAVIAGGTVHWTGGEWWLGIIAAHFFSTGFLMDTRK